MCGVDASSILRRVLLSSLIFLAKMGVGPSSVGVGPSSVGVKSVRWEWHRPPGAPCGVISQSGGQVEASLGTTPTPIAPDIILYLKIVGRDCSAASHASLGSLPAFNTTTSPFMGYG